MKFRIILDILFELLSKRRLTASELAEKHQISPRTVYRYVDVLATAVPVHIKRGREGGICLPDSYKLPANFLTSEEFSAAIEALSTAYEKSGENRFLNAIKKLSETEKNTMQVGALTGEFENFLIDTKETTLHFEKIKIIEQALREKLVLELEYGEKNSILRIEPHMLVFQEGSWYIFSFCHLERRFRLFPLSEILSVTKTQESFHARPFQKTDIPL